MKIFVFDTETTGFINKGESIEKQPRIVQFAGILGEYHNGEFIEEKRINQLINPLIPIPYASSQINHIYDIDVKDSPSFDKVADTILEYINTPDVIIGHNIEFDEEMIKLELRRLGQEYKYRPQQVKCSMKESTDFCRLEGNGNRYKYPKLGELYKILFDSYFMGAHDAMVDVEATLKCVIELLKNGTIVINETKGNNLISLF